MSPTKDEEREQLVGLIMKQFPDIDQDQAEKLYQSAVDGREIQQCGSVAAWFKNRVCFSMVVLDLNDYVTALAHSLRIAPNLAATDYGTSRQRDLGQLWTDTARGFLGEIALGRFAKERFGIQLIPDYTLGPLADYLPSDIKMIKLPNGNTIEPKLKVSFKTTKFNGIWLDIPGAQIGHSNAFILVKIGISREHFIAFLKWISFIRDKLLPLAKMAGTFDEDQAKQLWDRLPDFRKIPCYIVGFIDQNLVDSPLDPEYREKHDRSGKLKGYLMIQYVGWVKNRRPKSIPAELKDFSWEFISIGSFSAEDHFVANTGRLLFSQDDWKKLIGKLTGGKA